jgi:hypothetical protein
MPAPIDPATIEPTAIYRVDLARPVARPVPIRPRGDLDMRGDMLLAMIEQEGADVVLSAVAH